MILFLHGAAERGVRPEILKKHGIPRIVDEQPHFPFLAVSPQCPEGSTWARHVPTLRSLLDSVLEHYSADPDRLYLTGISMGGNGVWLLATRYPDLFAAVAPVCGYGLPSQEFPERVCVLKDIPVWVFHGSSDRIVHPSESRKLVRIVFEYTGWLGPTHSGSADTARCVSPYTTRCGTNHDVPDPNRKTRGICTSGSSPTEGHRAGACAQVKPATPHWEFFRTFRAPRSWWASRLIFEKTIQIILPRT